MNGIESLGGATLTGRFIALEPFAPRHREALAQAAEDRSIFALMPLDIGDSFAPTLDWLAAENEAVRMISYVVRRAGAVVGATSYLNIVPRDAKVEIGWTWYAKAAQGGAVNPEAKYLLLQNAFAAGCNRVEFKTDAKNARSRAALTKLGAREEGTLRAHMWVPQGYYRDSVYFSVLAAEWPGVKAKLEERLAAFS